MAAGALPSTQARGTRRRRDQGRRRDGRPHAPRGRPRFEVSDACASLARTSPPRSRCPDWLATACASACGGPARFSGCCARSRRTSDRVGRTIRLLRSQLVVMLAKPALVHFEWESVAVDFLPLFEACGCPVVVSSHGGIHVRPKIGDRRIIRAYPAIFARAAAVHCVSEAVREEAVRFGLDRAKARVIHTAVDVDFFSPAPSGVRDPEELRVIGVGRLTWQKGYDYALEAVASLVRAGVPVTYEILGGEPSAGTGKASDRGRLLYLIHELGLEGRVRLLGKVSQEVVRERLWASDVLLQASLFEGLPERGARGHGLRPSGGGDRLRRGARGGRARRRGLGLPAPLARGPGGCAWLPARPGPGAQARRGGPGRGSWPTSRSSVSSRASGACIGRWRPSEGAPRRSASRRATAGGATPSLESGRPNRWR